mmetsp:Transcript_125795/g.350511  ORF Transcript_125795/g.350511 Transcript_125795/m.350511 type:complete len:336 (+) Transcript_125795:1576-2583(+)
MLATQLKNMSAVALIAARVCCRFSCISARSFRMFTSSFSRAALILAASSILARSMASCTPISARLSSDCRRRSSSSFSPWRLCSSCLMLDSSCFCISSRSAAFFCAVSWATLSWCSFVLWSSLLRCSSSRILIVFCSSSQRSSSMLRFTRATSTSASAALRFSTRSARASRSTAWRKSSMNFSMTASCASVLLVAISRSCRASAMSRPSCTKLSSALARACWRTSTLVTVRMIWSSISSRFRLLSFCSSTTASMSFSSWPIVLSQYSALLDRNCREPTVTISTWLSRSIITFFVTLDTPFAFVQRLSGRSETAAGMTLCSSCVMMPSCRFEKNLL